MIDIYLVAKNTEPDELKTEDQAKIAIRYSVYISL